jgi:Fe-S-cluster-containing hydrogenase component 2
MRPVMLVYANLCQSCLRCQARQACKLRAIVQFESGDLPIIETQRCRGCQSCVPACPYGAIGPEDRPARSS